MTPTSIRRATSLGIALSLALAANPAPVAQAANPATGAGTITPAELKTWLTTISSDEFEGRATFSEGLGLAASYIAGELRAAGVRPGGDNGSYFQRVVVTGYKATSRSSITVTVNGQSKTFKDGEGITFPRNSGGKQTVSGDQVEFVGYGASLPMIKHDDYTGKSVSGKVVVYLGGRGPKIEDAAVARDARRLLGGRARYAADVMKAVASIGPFVPSPFAQAGPAPAPAATPTPAPSADGPGGRQGGGGGFGPQALPTPDFTAATRLDLKTPPAVTAQDAFFEFLFSASDVKYTDLKAKADAQGELPSFPLKGVSITFNVDADYQPVRTQYTRNVVGVIEGGDPKLKDSYVAFGAHYDHVGYAEGELVDTPVTEQNPTGKRRMGAVGAVTYTAAAISDRIWNGADDDGSGTVTLMSIAKAFASGPKQKRSLIFVWHTGEERGLWGSRYYADFPTVSTDKIVAQLNMDMVGRNDKDRASEENTVYLVGSDRISTELHNINEDANAASVKMKLDYTSNDPGDSEQIYYRSDHYSYAAKGVPIIFYTTGLHDDYHHNTDSVEKIRFEKMAKIAQLIYETGRRVANLDHAPARDNKGPRVGKGMGGKLQQ
jgi:hypothetical protein